MQSLAEAGTIAADIPVPCQIIAGDANATEISLAENAVREQMHPADEFDAFLALIEGGMRAADIAARFGVTETVVQQRLKLARVSPVIIAAYREGKIGLAHVMAFAVTDDHAAQENVWNELEEWQLEDPGNYPRRAHRRRSHGQKPACEIRHAQSLRKGRGAVRRDLFAQDDDGVFIQDIVLLESLVAKKLEKTAAAVRKEGWKWVEVRGSFEYSEWSDCERRYPEAEPLPAELQAELDALNAEYEKLNEAEWDDESGEENPRLDEITRRIEELDDREKSWQPETLAMAGAVVTIGHDGKAEIHYGFVKPEDAPKKKAEAKTTVTGADGTVTETEDAAVLSAALTENLTAHRSAAIAASLKDSPGVALAAVVHGMALQIFYNGHSDDTSLKITASKAALRDVQGSTASEALERAKAQWGDSLPGKPDDLLPWCLAQPQDTLLDLLATCAACTINAVRLKSDSADDERFVHADRLAAALRLDMAQWFTPTAANYFSRIGKTGIIEALHEVKGATAPAWHKAKKSELAAIAERELAGTGWLPKPLRVRE